MNRRIGLISLVHVLRKLNVSGMAVSLHGAVLAEFLQAAVFLQRPSFLHNRWSLLEAALGGYKLIVVALNLLRATPHSPRLTVASGPISLAWLVLDIRQRPIISLGDNFPVRSSFWFFTQYPSVFP